MTERTKGPDDRYGTPTYTGSADGKPVYWVARVPDRVDKIEKEYAKASPLLKLLMLNAYTLEGLTSAQTEEAYRLIKTTPEKGRCYGRQDYCLDGKAVGDTHLCRAHCRGQLAQRRLYAWYTR